MAALLATSVVAETDYVAKENVLKTGEWVVKAKDDFAVAGNLTVTSDLIVTGTTIKVPTLITITNDYVLTATGDAYEVDFAGSANGTSNAMTIANGVVGAQLSITIADGVTNTLSLVDGGNLKLSAAGLFNANDSIDLRVDLNTNWIERTRSAN